MPVVAVEAISAVLVLLVLWHYALHWRKSNGRAGIGTPSRVEPCHRQSEKTPYQKIYRI